MKKWMAILLMLAMTALNINFAFAAETEEGGTYYSNGKLCVNIGDLNAETSDFTLLIAAYDERDNLMSVTSRTGHTKDADGNNNLLFDYRMPAAARQYRVMLWDSLGGMAPLTDAVRKSYDGVTIKTLDIYTEEDIKQTADELFSNINANSEDIKYIYDEYSDGNYLTALGLFRNYMIDNLRKTPADIAGNAWNDSYDNPINLNLLDVMVGYMTLEEANGGVRTTVDGCNMLDYIDSSQPSHLNWIICDKTFPPGGTLLLGNYRHGFTGLAIRYMQTGDEIYAKKLVQLMEDYGMNYQPQSDAHFGYTGIALADRDILNVQMSEHTQYTDILVINRYGYRADGYNVSNSQRANSFFYAMSFLAKALPSENYEHEHGNLYPAKLSKMSFTDALSDEAYNIIDPVRWARWITHLAEWEFPSMCASVINFSGGTTNIAASAYQASLRYMALLKDFHVAEEYREKLFSCVNAFFEGTTHQDGTYIEKAFTYNLSEAENRLVTANVIDNIAPQWRGELYDFASNAEKWNKLVKICTSPLGLLAHVGNSYGAAGAAAIWTNPQQKAEFEKSLGVTVEDYTSEYLPYGGLGSFRSGWGIDDLYLSFFVNKDRYSGHSFAATNSILNLTAYGRTMLISGGMPWYGRSYVKTYTDFLASGYDEINGYMQENSSRKVSTVMVNGKSQENAMYDFDENGIVTSTYGTTLQAASAETQPGRWVSDTEFDYVEGVYDNAYTIRDTTKDIIPDLPDAEAITKDAIHNRRFIFVKNAGLWIVVDEMTNTAAAPNVYSAMWHFAAYEEGNKNLTGFKNEQVIMDEGEKTFYTKDEGKLNYDAPNLFAYNFSSRELSYKKYYGYYTPGDRQAFGWSFGGIDNMTGDYAKRPEVHVEWHDNGASDVSQVATVLIPSPDKNTKVSYKIDNSEGDTTAFEIGLKNGYVIKYTSNPNGAEVMAGNDVIKAKTVATVQKNPISAASGMVLDCESINGIADGGSFTFHIRGGKAEKQKNIERPMGY